MKDRLLIAAAVIMIVLMEGGLAFEFGQSCKPNGCYAPHTSYLP